MNKHVAMPLFNAGCGLFALHLACACGAIYLAVFNDGEVGLAAANLSVYYGALGVALIQWAAVIDRKTGCRP